MGVIFPDSMNAIFASAFFPFAGYSYPAARRGAAA
jgi:hypothetical protein